MMLVVIYLEVNKEWRHESGEHQVVNPHGLKTGPWGDLKEPQRVAFVLEQDCMQLLLAGAGHYRLSSVTQELAAFRTCSKQKDTNHG
jgi:hypothetical protein